MKMHHGEVDIDARIVRRLVAAQFPWFGDLPVRAVLPSTGTVNAIHRRGDRLCVRVPRVREWEGPDVRPAVTVPPRRAARPAPARGRRACRHGAPARARASATAPAGR